MEYDIRDFFTTESLESIEGIEDFVDVEKAFNRLSDREKKVTYLHLCGFTQGEIGSEVGISARTVRRILSNLSAFMSLMAQD